MRSIIRLLRLPPSGISQVAIYPLFLKPEAMTTHSTGTLPENENIPVEANSENSDCKEVSTASVKAKSEVTPKDFIKATAVTERIDNLKSYFNENNPLIVSDVLDENGNQYVNLVQKGGGVWGIALVGYTYVLEQMGIRFLRLAGTSAGAINTAMLAIVGEKEEPKSEKVIGELCALELFNLVDGDPAAKWVIQKIILWDKRKSKKQPDKGSSEPEKSSDLPGDKNNSKKQRDKGLAERLKIPVLIFTLLPLVLIVMDFVLLIFAKQKFIPYGIPAIAFSVSGLVTGIWGVILIYLRYLFNKLSSAGYGINPGDFFYDWLKCRFEKYKVYTVEDLEAKMNKGIQGVRLREGVTKDTKGLEGSITVIASELSTGNKIQFPEMYDLFRTKGAKDQLHPAGFVRASMAIPLFFESFYIPIPPNPETEQAWLKRFDAKPPKTARLVDGGLLSNFPVNLFFNPELDSPRLPTFGIDLYDELDRPTQKDDPARWEIHTYAGKMLGTLRGYYDKDFLLKYKAYKRGIGEVNMTDHDWLNFFMDKTEKVEMFVKGVKAADKFLREFDWAAYKKDQEEMRSQFKKAQP